MSVKDTKPLKQKQSKAPQPKWVAFQAMNYVVLAVFVSSVTFAISSPKALLSPDDDNSSHFKSELLPFALIWTCCLAYFFGFFGISFLDTEALSRSPSNHDLDVQAQIDADTAVKKPLQALQAIARVEQAKSSAPRNDTTICSDPKPTKAELDGTSLDFENMEDDDVLECVLKGTLKDYQLENKLKDHTRAVFIRRRLYENLLDQKLETIPYLHYDYGKVFGANCEVSSNLNEKYIYVFTTKIFCL